MSSKLITGEDAAAAPLLVWHDVNGAVSQTESDRSPQSPTGDDGTRLGRLEEQRRQLAAQQARIQQLEQEVESRPRQAYQRGYNEGQAAGAEQAGKRLESVLANFAKSLQDLASVRKRHLLESEEDAVRLAIAVARKILHRELSVDPDALLGIVKAAFERVEARDVHRLRINPEDVAALQRHLAALGMPPRMEVVEDASLERGSVVVESARGNLDASVSTQLKEIERGLVDLVRRNS